MPESMPHRATVSPRTLGAVLICISAALWGLDGVVLTPRLANLPVPFVVFLLHAIPFALMQPFFFRTYPEILRAGRRAWGVLLLVSLSGGLVGTLAIVKALFLVNFEHLSVVVLLQKLQPLFAILLAAWILEERITWRFMGWAVLAIVGAYFLTFGATLPDLSSDSEGVEAALWALLAAAAFGSATVLGKLLLGALDFRRATFARYGCTSLLALAYVAITGVGLPFQEVTPTNWALIFLIGITTGSGAIFLYYYGLTRVPASLATVCELCLPGSAVLFDYLVNDSILRAWQWVGALLLVGSIVRISTLNGKGRR